MQQQLAVGLLRSGLRPFEVTQRVGLPYKTVQRIAIEHGVRCRGRHLSEAEKAKIRRMREVDGMSLRAIAREMGIGKSTVWVWAQRRLEAVADQGGVVVRPVRVRRPRRCPRHGLLTLWPCVACAAEANRDRRT